MKPHHILTGFKGSQDGHGDGEEFVAGTTAHLSDDLARIAVGEGWAKLPDGFGVKPSPVTIQPPLSVVPSTTEPEVVNEPKITEELVNPVESRETKVVGPEETKVAQPEETKADTGLAAMSYKDLLTLAKERGLKAIGLKKEALVAALDGKA